MTTDFARMVADALKNERFTLLDLGCSGGIDPHWRVFRERFRALGIDASASECRRLASLEQHPDVHYRAAFVRMMPDHPAYPDFAGKPFSTRSPFVRTSAHRTVQLLDKQIETGSSEDKLLFNQWSRTELADETAPVSVEGALAERAWSDVDFIKIDIDNADFEVLTAIADSLSQWQVLGAKLEVNFFGGTSPTEGTFHNTDRLMRSKGYTLVGLERCQQGMSTQSRPRHIPDACSRRTHTTSLTWRQMRTERWARRSQTKRLQSSQPSSRSSASPTRPSNSCQCSATGSEGCWTQTKLAML